MGGYYPHVEQARPKSTRPEFFLTDVRREATQSAGLPELASKDEVGGPSNGIPHCAANSLLLAHPSGTNSVTQSLRALMAGRGVKVHAVLPGPIDTDMIRDLPIPKTSPDSVAAAIFNGVEHGDEEIFPDPFSETQAESWRLSAAKELERQNAALVLAEPIAA